MSALALAAVIAIGAPAPANAWTTVAVRASVSGQAHIQNLGNQFRNEAIDLTQQNRVIFTFGTEGRSLRLEQVGFSPIEIDTGRRRVQCSISLQGHVQDIGWQSRSFVAGTTGKGLRLEAIRIWSSCAGASIKYQVHVQNRGWMSTKTSGETAGTVGQSLRIEAIRVEMSLPDFSAYRSDAQRADQLLCQRFGC
ncbi:Ig domain-containing protein [Microbacterium sp. XT11]|uniref:Ig domain-containing protein n=1 Tax=Microbacterium sp. XT11 TaxID=367477 RepID=UPI0018DB71B7|nr:Ig domain-containing protein [Microbacterium sp. XT11]